MTISKRDFHAARAMARRAGVERRLMAAGVLTVVLAGCGSSMPVTEDAPTPVGDSADSVAPVMHCAPQATSQAASARLAQGDCDVSAAGQAS